MLAGLDPDQRVAASAISGALLILAGPGTGKTRTLTHRIAHLIVGHGVPPESCLAVTFTRRAAGEMRERLNALLPGGSAARVPVVTFHALGLAILRDQEDRLDLGAPLRVANETEILRLASDVLGVSFGDARRLMADPASRPEGYVQALRCRGWVDFDDLIDLPVALLSSHADLVGLYRRRWPHLSVDEFQDIDPRQYELVRLLADGTELKTPDAERTPADGAKSVAGSDGARSLCVIGDPDQSIYGFRGADVGLFDRFRADYPAARTVTLRHNYRSTKAIVSAALQAIAPATLVRGRVLRTRMDGGDRIVSRECADERAEAGFVVETIERLVGGTSLVSIDMGRGGGETPPYAFNDFAVLYRTDAQTPPLVDALARSGIPFQKRSHTPLADHPTLRALLAQVKTQSPGTPLSGRLANAVAHLAREAGPDPDLRPLADAIHPLAVKHGANLDALTNELALGFDVDLLDPRAERVSLLTMHAAKGLEFRVVFIVGCEDGLLPHRFDFRDAAREDVAEECRLFFVGMTRAGERLILTRSRRRHWRGAVRDRVPSPFLRSIPDALVDRQREARPVGPRGRQMQLF